MNNNEEEATSFRNSHDEEAAPFRDYAFHLKTGEIKIGKGYLAIAQSFAAVGSGSGDLSLVVPLDNLLFTEELPAIAGSA